MSRLLRRAAIVVAVLVAIALVVLRAMAPALVESFVERAATEALGTPVTVGDCDLSLVARELRVRDVEVLAPVEGADDPLLHVDELAIGGPSTADGGTLRFASVRARGLRFASEGSDEGGQSSAAALQDSAQESAAAAPAGGEGEDAAWPRRLEFASVVVDDAVVRAHQEAAGGERDSTLTLRHVEVRDLAVPLEPESLDVVSLTAELEGLGVAPSPDPAAPAMLSVERAGLDLRLAKAAPGADDLVVEVPRVEVDGAALAGTSGGDDSQNVVQTVRVWAAALSGIELPGVASARLDRATLSRGSVRIDRLEKPTPLLFTAISIVAKDIDYPRVEGRAGTIVASAHPLVDSARLEVQVSGNLFQKRDPGSPMHLAVHAVDIPVHLFPVFHLDAGSSDGDAALALSQGRLSGPMTVRLDGIDVADGAPLSMQAAYAALSASTSPELTVPVSLVVGDMRGGEIALLISQALVERAGRDVGGVIRGTARGIGDSIRRGFDKLSR